MLFNLPWPRLLRLLPYGAVLALSMLCWHFWHRAVANADAVRTQAAAFTQAQHDADRTWANKFAQQQEAYNKESEDAQKQYQVGLSRSRDAADAFIRLHAAPTASYAQGGPSAAKAETTGIPAGMPARVTVDAGLVQTCNDLHEYAVGAFKWAQSVSAQPEAAPTP